MIQRLDLVPIGTSIEFIASVNTSLYSVGSQWKTTKKRHNIYIYIFKTY
jgi:hypothetical protein